MAHHPGVLNTTIHKEGPPNALQNAYMKNFPITDEQAAAAAARGNTIYDVSVGQVVTLRNGAGFVHGAHDGLHISGDEIF